MSLELRSLRLKNWKCYQDVELDFANSKNAKIWIIFGQNGFGKTSILEAMQWCLYGSTVVSPAELANRFNRGAVKKTSKSVLHVALSFKDGDRIINISRSAKYSLKGKTPSADADEPTVSVNGVSKQDTREFIDSLLPAACREFFFFDGVEIKRYAQKIHEDETKDAIERILGIPELRNLRADMRKALSDLDDKFSEASEANKELNEIEIELDKKQSEIGTTEEQLEWAKEQHRAAEELLNAVASEAEQVEALRGKLRELERKEHEQARFGENLERIEREIERAVGHACIPLLVPFARTLANELQRTAYTSAKRAGSAEVLEQLLEETQCLCGRELDDDARKYISRHIKRAKELKSSDEPSLRVDDLRRHIDLLANYEHPDFEQSMKDRDELEEELDEVKQAIKKLTDDTGDLSDEDADNTWRKKQDCQSNVEQMKRNIRELSNDLEELRKEEADLRRKREELAASNEATKVLAAQASLARRMATAAEELISWRLEDVKSRIEELTSTIHKRVTNKPKEYVGIAVNADYSIAIRHVNGSIISPDTLSAGEKEALAFSFITALNIASEKAAPFVMDTPFGHLDTTHQKNLVESLPNLPSQVIVLATDRDFPGDLLKNLRPHVAAISNIRRVDGRDDYSVVEPA